MSRQSGNDPLVENRWQMVASKRAYRGRGRVGALIMIAMILHASPLSAQQRSATPGYSPTIWLGSNEPFEIVRSGTEAQAFAVVIDKLDISSLFERAGGGKLRYRGRGPALPSGIHTLTVYDVDANGAWTQIGQFPIQILTRRGFISAKVTPSADLTGKGQLGEDHSPDSNAPQRGQFQDATMQLGLNSELVRPLVTVRAQAQVAGVTYQNEALRFGTERDAAPKIDLSGYRIDVQHRSAVLSVGQLNVGVMRHLINSFQSRGVALTVGEGKPVTFQIAAMNGSNIAGWDNALGISHAGHQFRSASLGFEAVRSKPGLLRFETGLFLGSAEPATGFNSGGVVTAEKSRGAAMRVSSSSSTGRWRFDGGYTSSRFDNGFDRQVEEGLVVTPIRTRTSNAFYVDSSLALLQNRTVGARTMNLTLNLRHEDLDPQFRSLGVSAQPDQRSSAGELVWSAGSVSGTVGHARSRDNLAAIESILTSRREGTNANVSIPFKSLLQRGTVIPKWAPTVSVQAETFHQYGDHLPTRGDFTIESIPDQLSWNANLSADWQIGTGRVGGRFSRSKQDNRQIGSEHKDFTTSTGALTFGWSPNAKFSSGGELSLDRNHSTDPEQRKTDVSFRWSASFNWMFYRNAAISASINNTRGWDSRDARDSHNLNGFAEISAPFRLSRSADRRKARLFVRYIHQSNDLFDRTFGLRNVRSSGALATGLTVSMF